MVSKIIWKPARGPFPPFLVMIAYAGFIIIHVMLVMLTGFTRNMNHITLGTDGNSNTGIYIGFALVILVTGFCIFAHWASWHKPRTIQKWQAAINGTLWRYSINRLKPKSRFTKRYFIIFLAEWEHARF